MDDEGVLLELEVEDTSFLEGEEGSESTGRAHAGWVGFGWWCNPKVTPSPAAHFFTPVKPPPKRSYPG